MNSWFFFYCAVSFAAFGIEALFSKQPSYIFWMWVFLSVVFHVVAMWERDKLMAHHNFTVHAAREMQKLLAQAYPKLVKLENYERQNNERTNG